MEVPADAPSHCPVCDVAYDSVSEHGGGVMVNLLDNARYRRVCFEPTESDSKPRMRFYHHTHEQVGAGDTEDDASSDRR
ncbi:hypothetical protein SAMN04487950_2424 [Halogranum rubrum]|uniref:DUF8145 domain-containing protein n=1 Tax=Halogranum rubrum TaxID=553466 RepID=A0A1I4EV94_9EURY|nr:hypothetical protein [Halogranum rubrum]SFL09632.1 hypothetical protein SAMN04487950_2424 [Halogranum rubrum]